MNFQIPYHVYRSKYPTKLLAFYHALRDSIVGGVLALHTKLPSSRELAGLYDASRGTINQVYDMLACEGYVVCEVGRGTFVSYQADGRKSQEARPRIYSLSRWGERAIQQQEGDTASSSWSSLPAGERRVDFHLFAPAIERFPHEEWNRCLYATARSMSAQTGLSPVLAQGDMELRESIAQYLRRARGIAADVEQIVIVNGSLQAIALLTQLLVNPGEPVIVENPGYSGIRRSVQAAGGVWQPVDVDEQGIVPDDWAAKLLFVTPSRQFPTGAVLGLERRQQLLKWAYEREAVIIEDDYDSEFRHRGKPLEPLKVLDREERVIYIGSFSKSLLPGIRIGYAVLPSSLVEPLSKAKALFMPQPAGMLEQKTLAAFMASGQYERHLRRMKRVYSRKFECLRRLTGERLSDRFEWVDSDAGLHLFGWWRGSAQQYSAFRERCGKAGIRWSEVQVEVPAGSRFGAYFHFPHLSEEDMDYAILRMRDISRGLG